MEESGTLGQQDAKNEPVSKEEEAPESRSVPHPFQAISLAASGRKSQQRVSVWLSEVASQYSPSRPGTPASQISEVQQQSPPTCWEMDN